MKFAFLIHPLNESTQALLHLDSEGLFHQQWGRTNLYTFCAEAHRNVRIYGAGASAAGEPRVRIMDDLTGLVSATGARVEGRFFEIPMLPHEIVHEPDRALSYIENAVDEGAEWGASLAGLGSMTGVIGNRGLHLTRRGPLPVTTGNNLTVYAALKNLDHIGAAVGLDLQEETVAINGIPSTLANGLAHALAGKCRELLLISKQPSTRAKTLADKLNARLLVQLPEALARTRVVLSATSSGACIDPKWLQAGTVVLDVSLPTDVMRTEVPRDDILIIAAGMARIPETMPRDSVFLGFYQGIVPSCLGETMVLALEGRAESFSVGREVDLARMEEIGKLAERHGFDFTRLMSSGLPVQPSALAHFRKIVTRCRRSRENGYHRNGHSRNGHGHGSSGAKGAWDAEALASRVAELHGRYLNPVLAALGGKSGTAKTFVRGEGTHLYDEKGEAYLDFVSGCGAVNLGHNHPAVVAGITAALKQQAPGFTQSTVTPLAAALAEQLVGVTPPGLDMAFFTSSGAESVEAGVKLARAVTGRPGLLACEGGYHGKTLGALGLTDHRRGQHPFGPLVPGIHRVPFGDLEALAQVLASRQCAAFIVEPIQAEGGINVAPRGDLTEAQRICRKTGTLLLVDEVQTGLGRTGEMFALEHEGVEPDALLLAKSLGGGLVPLGAMLTRRDLWMKAYGTYQAHALNSNTFSGGSLACAAGLATLRVLQQEHLVENVRRRGQQLQRGLAELCRQSPFLSRVRGQGLLLGVEFHPMPETMVRHFKGMDPSVLNQYLMPGLDDWLVNLPALYTMNTLLNGHGIYTQVTGSNPRVLRVQPPLTVSDRQVKTFLDALEKTCADLAFIVDLPDAVVSRSIGDSQ